MKRARNQALPEVAIVDMRSELKSGNRSMFSVALADAIRKRLEAGEQMIRFYSSTAEVFLLSFSAGIAEQPLNARIAIFH